jgi:hypothetical protein
MLLEKEKAKLPVFFPGPGTLPDQPTCNRQKKNLAGTESIREK